MSISKQIPKYIKCVSRTVGFALWLDEWEGLPVILRARLNNRQRAALAFMALKSLKRDDAAITARAALAEEAGQPIAPLFNHMDEAAFWADMAEPEALEAYCLASFNRMAPAQQSAFLGFVQRRAA